MRVSIHQPNFMPWYPFFQKMMMCDIFVVMKHCQFEKNGFQNRFNHLDKWYTMSTFRGLDPIHSKKYVNPQRDWKKIKKSFPKKIKTLEMFDQHISDNLFDTNFEIIKEISKMLDIKCDIVVDFETDKTGTDRLVEICKNYGASTYISGMSGKKYLETEKFVDSGINLEFQKSEDMNKISIVEVL